METGAKHTTCVSQPLIPPGTKQVGDSAVDHCLPSLVKFRLQVTCNERRSLMINLSVGPLPDSPAGNRKTLYHNLLDELDPSCYCVAQALA